MVWQRGCAGPIPVIGHSIISAAPSIIFPASPVRSSSFRHPAVASRGFSHLIAVPNPSCLPRWVTWKYSLPRRKVIGPGGLPLKRAMIHAARSLPCDSGGEPPLPLSAGPSAARVSFGECIGGRHVIGAVAALVSWMSTQAAPRFRDAFARGQARVATAARFTTRSAEAIRLSSCEFDQLGTVAGKLSDASTSHAAAVSATACAVSSQAVIDFVPRAVSTSPYRSSTTAVRLGGAVHGTTVR